MGNTQHNAYYSDEELLKMYHTLKRGRVFMHKMEEAIYRGEMKLSLHSAEGQEATTVGIISALKDTDWIGYTHRSTIMIYERMGLKGLIAEMYGKEGGYGHGSQFDFHVCDYDKARLIGLPSALGDSVPQCAGFAFGLKKKGRPDNEIVLNLSGNGACSEGAVYEGWNFAALLKLPIVFVIEDNGWASGTASAKESASPVIAEKAGACGLDYQVVWDGTDLLAVRRALDNAIENARNCKPSVVEIKNLRWGAHCIGIPMKYREGVDLDLVEAARSGKGRGRYGDPVARYEDYLKGIGLIDDDEIKKLEEEYGTQIRQYQLEAAEQDYASFDQLYRKEYVYATPETGEDL